MIEYFESQEAALENYSLEPSEVDANPWCNNLHKLEHMNYPFEQRWQLREAKPLFLAIDLSYYRKQIMSTADNIYS